MIFVLPGMGADAGMFTGSWRNLPDAVFVNWPPHTGEHTLAEIAQKIVTTHGITEGAVVIGTSLGGMVACEIARILHLRRLILIGSATHPSEINALLTSLQPLHRVAPVSWLQWSAGSVPGEIARSFSQSETAFIRSAIDAILKWDGLDPSLPRPLRIHGRHDVIIPPPPDADLLVEGGHLIAMSHARLCCDFITESLSNPAPRHPA